jgi:hypothetical protein
LEEVKKLKRLKSFFSAIFKKINQKSLEEFERMLKNEREIYLLKRLHEELKEDNKNNNYNVFVYDTILYPPGSSPHYRFN